MASIVTTEIERDIAVPHSIRYVRRIHRPTTPIFVLIQHRCVDDDEPRLKPFKRSSEPWLEDMNSSFRMSSVVSVLAAGRVGVLR